MEEKFEQKQKTVKKQRIETKVKLWSGEGLDKNENLFNIRSYPTFNDTSETIKVAVQKWLGSSVWQLSMEQLVQVVIRESPRCVQAQRIKEKVKGIKIPIFCHSRNKQYSICLKKPKYLEIIYYLKMKEWLGKQKDFREEEDQNQENQQNNQQEEEGEHFENSENIGREEKKNGKPKEEKIKIIKSIKSMPVTNRKAKIIKEKVENWLSNNESSDENIERDIETAFKTLLSQPPVDEKANKIKKQVLTWLAEDVKSQKIRSTVLEWSGKIKLQESNNSNTSHPPPNSSHPSPNPSHPPPNSNNSPPSLSSSPPKSPLSSPPLSPRLEGLSSKSSKKKSSKHIFKQREDEEDKKNDENN